MIIAFSGRSRCGKTTAANFLTANFNFIRRAFADGLRSLVASLFNLDAKALQDFKDYPLPNSKRTPRDILIQVGCSLRDVDPNVWFNYWERDLEKVVGQFPNINVAVDDLRFRNEFDKLRAKGAHLIRIERSLHAVTDEPSETDLDQYAEQGLFDHTIHNTGGLDDFYYAVSKHVSDLLVKQYVEKNVIPSGKIISLPHKSGK